MNIVSLCRSLIARFLTIIPLMFLFLTLAPALGLIQSAQAVSFMVDIGNTDNGDNLKGDGICNDGSGKCSLRAAIEEGNSLAGIHVITLSPSLSTIEVINGALPTMMAPFTLTGNGSTTINGNGHGCLSLSDSGTAALGHDNGATGSSLSYLVIGHCSGDAISANGHNYVFSHNHIGVDATGLIKLGNTGHGISVSASHVYQDTSSNFLLNLYNSFPVQPVDASTVETFSNNLATVLASLSPIIIKDNVISGNSLNGLEIFSKNLAAVIASNNMIGTDFTGNVAIPNGGAGIHLVGSTFGNMIGPNNVISGNGGDGIKVDAGTVFLPNFIMGNRIGLAATNLGQHIGNGLNGISTDTKPDDNPLNFNPSMTALVIGPGNLISDNKGANNNAFPDSLSSDSAGILITGTSKSVKVTGNTIGLAEFPPGTPILSKDYGNAGDGIIMTSSGNSISGNTIAANVRHGVVIKGSSTTGNTLLGNSIGVLASMPSNLSLGNGVDGIHINAANSTTIGGPEATDYNVIAANGRNGVKIRNGGSTNGWSNMLQRNQIYSNSTMVAGIGIDLDRSENMADPQHSEFPANYANLDQNEPRICTGPADTDACSGSTAPASLGGTTTLDWMIETHGPADFRMEFFRINVADDNLATSMTFLGEQLITTGLTGLPSDSASCSAGRCRVILPVSAGGGYIVMTATDITPLTDQPGGGSDWKSNLMCFGANVGLPVLPKCNVNNTSEYSNAVAVPLSPPTAQTNPAANISKTGADLLGSVSANGSSTIVTFEYGSSNAYGGAGSPLTAVQSPLAVNSTNAPVSVTLSNLACDMTYHFRVNANNGVGGVIHGNDQSFTTAACAALAPTVTTNAASSITTTGALLNGVVSANGAITAVTFEYGLTNAYGGVGSPMTATESPLSSGSNSAPVTFAVSGLVCNTTYHFRVNANNGIGGAITGNDMSFLTAPCSVSMPTVTSSAASLVTSTSATLNGIVNANGGSTVVTFEYGLTTAYGGLGSPGTALQSPLTSGSLNAPVSLNLTGLACNTTYHYRVNANNGVGGTINGSDQSFKTTACAPTIASNAATLIENTSAVLNGMVNANGSSTMVTFEYGPTAAYGGVGSPLTATQSPLLNSISSPVSVPVSGLVCNTLYHFRVAADNGVGGVIYGSDQTFTTAVCAAVAPMVTTNGANNITASSATVNGLVTANGASTAVSFDYGLTSAYGAVGSPINASQSPLSSGANNAAVSAILSNLACATTYHFRVAGNNGVGGIINGNDMSFTTSACPAQAPNVVTNAATAITTNSAVLNGLASANGASTTVAFEYGLTAAYGGAGSPMLAGQNPIAANVSNASISISLANLSCGSTYHYRAQASNGIGGVVNGLDQTFKTASCATTTTINNHSPDPSSTLQPIAVTAVIAPNSPSANTPSGTITVSDGAGANCVITLPATSCNLSVISAGAKTLTASYSGDSNFVASNAAGVSHTVTPVTSFTGATATGTGNATATLSGVGCTFTNAQFIQIPGNAPANIKFADGLFDFKVGGCGVGASATVQITYPNAIDPGVQYWKYGATPGPVAAHWYTLANGAPNNLVINGKNVTFTLTDGALGDDDLIANGIIDDDGGPGLLTCYAPEILENYQCVIPKPTCVAPQVLQNNQCVTPTPTCVAPQILQNNQCITPVPTCVAPEVLQNNVCVIPVVNNSIHNEPVILAAGETVTQQTYNDRVQGDAQKPAVLRHSIVNEKAVLSNVIIDEGTSVNPKAILKEGVRFTQNSLIPPGIDLTQALGQIPGSTPPAVNLNQDVVSGNNTLLKQIQVLSALSGLSVSQNEAGVLLVQVGTQSYALRPVQVLQAVLGTPAGISFTADGRVQIVTSEGRQITLSASLGDFKSLQQALANLGLTLNSIDPENGNLAIGNNARQRIFHHFAARPALFYEPAKVASKPGLYLVPEPLSKLSTAYLVFEQNGQLWQQVLVPVPEDWLSLKAALQQQLFSNITLNVDGIIQIDSNKQRYRGVMDYLVNTGDSAGTLRFEGAGDLNGDGIGDLMVIYPDGHSQALFLLPISLLP